MKREGPTFKTSVNKQKHVFRGKTLGARKASGNGQDTRARVFATAKPPLPRPDSWFRRDPKAQHTPPPEPEPSRVSSHSLEEGQSTHGFRPQSHTNRPYDA